MPYMLIANSQSVHLLYATKAASYLAMTLQYLIVEPIFKGIHPSILTESPVSKIITLNDDQVQI